MKKLVFIGDSLTGFYDWQGRFPGYEAINLGIAGERVEELLGRIDTVCNSISRPDYVFLMTGINNIAMEEYDIASAYGELLKRMTSCFGDTLIVVQSILPVRLPWVENNRIEKLNISLKELAGEFHAYFLDLYSLFTGPDGAAAAEYLLDDGVHLSSKGYKKWSNAVERFFQKHDA